MAISKQEFEKQLKAFVGQEDGPPEVAADLVERR